jgi:hypothetical protein
MRKKTIARNAYGVQMMNLVAVAVSFIIIIATAILMVITEDYYGVECAYGGVDGLFSLFVFMVINTVSYVIAELIKPKMES